MENSINISKEEYAALIQEETKLEMIEQIITNKNIKFESDKLNYIRVFLGIEEE